MTSAVDLLVLEMRRPLDHRRFSVSASGEIKLTRSFETKPDRIDFGQVPIDHVEKLHEVLRKVGFCTLAPKHREMAPGYIVIEVHFSDVACAVELPDTYWDKTPRAKKVIDAVRTLAEEGCPTGCKP